MMKLLEGKKAYLGAASVFILGGCFALGLISKEQFDAYVAMAAAFTAYGIRDKMNRM